MQHPSSDLRYVCRATVRDRVAVARHCASRFRDILSARLRAHCKAVEKNGQNFSGVKQSESKAPRRLCVVVADDDRDAVLTLMMLLREEGHDALGAYDAQQTMDACLKYDPDVLVLDIALGQASGYDVAKKVRDRHGDERPMIIGISGQFKKGSDRILASIAGFNHYFVKPYDASDLLAVLAPLTIATPARRIEDGHQSDTYRESLASAAAVVGGARELADRLRVGMTDLTRWLAGTHKPPLNVFLRVIDIILDERKKSQDLHSRGVIDFPKPPEPKS